MASEKTTELDAVVDEYYRDVLELRSRVLRENPGINQDEYSVLVGKAVIPFFNHMVLHMSKRIPNPDFECLTDRMRGINQAVLRMLV